MASATPLKDLEENFCLCSVCLEIFQEPKLLPCLHRYCIKCLQSVVNASHDGMILCPMCKQQCSVPDNGIDGFKTDFHMKNIVEFLQLQKAFENDDLKKCVSCFNDKNPSAYCSKCKDFLCEQCYNVHISSKMFTDHKPRTLKLDKAGDRNISLETLAALTENPRCRTHLEENAKVCCSTCTNEPICVICIYGKHKGHDLHDVIELAQNERKFLNSKVAELWQLRGKLYQLPRKVEATKQKLNENVAKQTDKLINQHKEQVNKIKQKLEKRKQEKEQGLTDIEERRKDEERQTNLNYEEEINKLNKKYDEIRTATERKYSNECQLFKDNCEKDEKELESKLGILDISLKKLTESIDNLTEEHTKEVVKISDYCDQIIKRYENTTAIASSILAAKDKWALVQCMPDIRAACEPLIEEMKKEYPQLDSLSDIYIGNIPNLVGCDVIESEREQSVVYVKELEKLDGRIDGIASCRNGHCVISGGVYPMHVHIAVIDRKGKIQTQNQFNYEKRNYRFQCFCCFLSYSEVATVCTPDEIGIFNVFNGSYRRRLMKDVIPTLPARTSVLCVANDPVAKHIIVGATYGFVYVFNDHLNYIRTIKLPTPIGTVRGITVHASKLLVCSSNGVFAVTMKGSESKLMYEFDKPDLAGGNGGPLSVCIDKNDCIYMLWGGASRQRFLLHYNLDGRLLLMKTVNTDATCLTTVDVDGSEKLLIANSRKIYEYNITVT